MEATYQLEAIIRDLENVIEHYTPRKKLSEAIEQYAPYGKNKTEREENCDSLCDLLGRFSDLFGVSQFDAKQRKAISTALRAAASDVIEE